MRVRVDLALKGQGRRQGSSRHRKMMHLLLLRGSIICFSISKEHSLTVVGKLKAFVLLEILASHTNSLSQKVTPHPQLANSSP